MTLPTRFPIPGTILGTLLLLTSAVASEPTQDLRVRDRLHETDGIEKYRDRGGSGAIRVTPQPGPAGITQEELNALDADTRVTKGVIDRVTVDSDGTLDLLITYTAPPDATMWDKITALDGEIVRTFDSVWGCSARVDANRLDELLADESIAQVDWNAPMGFSMNVARTAAQLPLEPDDSGPGSAQPLGEMFTGVTEQAINTLVELNGNGVTIALLDSGVRSHEDLDNLIGCVDLVESPELNPLDPYQITAELIGGLGYCTSYSDPFGHGTHIAGILIGDGKHSNGHYAGIAPGAQLLSVRVLGDEGSSDVATVLSGIEWVIDHKDDYGIDILSLSLGGPFYVPAAEDPLVKAVERAWDQGIVVVTSAGNLGTYGNFTVTRPGNSPKIITVGSLTDWNSLTLPDDLVSSYSSLAPTLIDGYLKPDLVAPGNRIISTRAAGSLLDQLLKPMGAVFDDEYLEMSGTSMATPIVAATAALMLEADPTLTPDTIKARLMLSADTVPGSALQYGAGRLNATKALRQTGTATDARSPHLLRAAKCCDLYVEEVSGDWGAFWSSTAIWGDTFIWSDTAMWSDTFMWSDTAMWADTFLWSETAMWSDSVVLGE